MFEGHPLFSMESVYRAYRRCRRHKRGTVNAMRFEEHLEENLVSLHEELASGAYRPGQSVAFMVEKPKRREIFAADFRDRVAHHVLVGHLEPAWERRFIYDSYACRQGKGTHAGVDRLRSFTRQATANGTRRAWYLQLDVRGFFITLNRDILFERIASKERDPAVLWLARTLIFHEPAENCRLRGAKRADFESLLVHKTLFKAQVGCGLPIGNLTSQFFANVYLDALDQFVKHELKARFYVRYCDDLVLVSESREELERWEREIAVFLSERLRLQLNERRKLRPVTDGIDFLGYVVRPDYLLVRRRVVAELRRRLEKTEKILRESGMAAYADGHKVYVWPFEVIRETLQWLQSYLGHFRRASAFRLVSALYSRFSWLHEYFVWQGGRIETRYPIPRQAMSFSAQCNRFKAAFPAHAVLVQLGSFWQVLSVPASLISDPCRQKGACYPTGRFHKHESEKVRDLLWRMAVPVAWIGETGRRIGPIAERALKCRWEYVGPKDED